MEQLVRDFLLHHPEFRGMQVELETMPSGRVTGQVVWEGFTGQDQYGRQRILRMALEQHFGPDVQYIGVLLTYTPDEMREMVAA